MKFKSVSVNRSEIGEASPVCSLSFFTGRVPHQWRCAIVTPVSKLPKPAAISDYRSISVTPLLSRTAERIIVMKWLLPVIPFSLLDDQFGFRPTVSTECALVFLMHHVTAMLEKCDYVRCLLIDFSRAFDTVDHAILLSKLTRLNSFHSFTLIQAARPINNRQKQ